MRRRTLYGPNKIESKPIDEANYADVCFVDNSSLDKIIVSVDKIDDSFPIEYYTPIGVVAVPSSHTDEERPRIMSLVDMSCDTPEIGSTEAQYIFWGVYGTVVNGLAQKNYFPYIERRPSGVTSNETVKFTQGYPYLPSDANGDNGLGKWVYENPSNSNEHFCYSSNIDYYYYMCSPYKQDGSKDTRYFDTSNTGNVLADFDGKSNTDKILEQRGAKDYTTWKPTSHLEEDYPAASCSDMFYTIGTNQGDWYLPSAGELGYAVARQQAIQNSLQALVTKGYTASLLSTKYYWSSTQYSSNGVVILDFLNGNVSYNLKNNDHYVRAFLAL